MFELDYHGKEEIYCAADSYPLPSYVATMIIKDREVQVPTSEIFPYLTDGDNNTRWAKIYPRALLFHDPIWLVCYANDGRNIISREIRIG